MSRLITPKHVEVLTLLLIVTRSTVAQAQPSDPPEMVEAATCARCHTTGQKMEDPQLVLHNEFVAWKQLDPHHNAYEILKREQSRKIGEKLYNDPNVLENDKCLSCHATKVEGNPQKLTEEGVSCVACHGSSHRWIVEHALGDADSWMRRTAGDKSSNFGMTDLRNPLIRADLCLSCHIGNEKQGKILTHEMYAAGHPPLATIDLSDSSRLFPKHWLSANETPYILSLAKEPVLQRDGYHFDAAGITSANRAIESAFGNMDTQVREFAKQELKYDFARYDCTSCHRELKAYSSKEWEQLAKLDLAREIKLTPLWPVRMMNDPQNVMGIRQIDPDRNLQAFLDARRVPFREFDVSSLSVQLEKLRDIKDLPITKREDARNLLRYLCSLGESPLLDFDSARQLAWWSWAIANELRVADAPGLKAIFEKLDNSLFLGLFATDAEVKTYTSGRWMQSQQNFRAQDTCKLFAELSESFR